MHFQQPQLCIVHFLFINLNFFIKEKPTFPFLKYQYFKVVFMKNDGEAILYFENSDINTCIGFNLN